MKSFILMIQFLTRIPIPVELQVTKGDFEKGPVYFPLVGLIIGAILAAVYHLLIGNVSSFLLGILIVVLEVFLTGGLHLDGLADTFDGIYSNRDRERMLEIMKDSRLGANGALALLFFMLLKVALVMELNAALALPVLLIMPVVSRCNLVVVCRYAKYAREDGMGNLFIEKVSSAMLVVALLTTLGIVLWAMGDFVQSAWLYVGGILLAPYYMKHVSSKLGGMTGDTLGALCELSEIWILGLAVLLQVLVV